jgi:hypothetical protein
VRMCLDERSSSFAVRVDTGRACFAGMARRSVGAEAVLRA